MFKKFLPETTSSEWWTDGGRGLPVQIRVSVGIKGSSNWKYQTQKYRMCSKGNTHCASIRTPSRPKDFSTKHICQKSLKNPSIQAKSTFRNKLLIDLTKCIKFWLIQETLLTRQDSKQAPRAMNCRQCPQEHQRVTITKHGFSVFLSLKAAAVVLTVCVTNSYSYSYDLDSNMTHAFNPICIFMWLEHFQFLRSVEKVLSLILFLKTTM